MKGSHLLGGSWPIRDPEKEAGIGEKQGWEKIRCNYLVSLESGLSRHTGNPLFTLNAHQQRMLQWRPQWVPEALSLPDPPAGHCLAEAVPRAGLTSSILVRGQARGDAWLEKAGSGGHGADLTAHLTGVAQVAENTTNRGQSTWPFLDNCHLQIQGTVS